LNGGEVVRAVVKTLRMRAYRRYCSFQSFRSAAAPIFVKVGVEKALGKIAHPERMAPQSLLKTR